MEPLVSIVITLIVIGLVLYLVESLLPIPDPFKMVIRVVIVLIAIIYLLRVLGVYSGPLLVQM